MCFSIPQEIRHTAAKSLLSAIHMEPARCITMISMHVNMHINNWTKDWMAKSILGIGYRTGCKNQSRINIMAEL